MPNNELDLAALYEIHLTTLAADSEIPAELEPAFQRWAFATFAAKKAGGFELNAEAALRADFSNKDLQRAWKFFQDQRIKAERAAAAAERDYFALRKRLALPAPSAAPPAAAQEELVYTPERAREAQAFLDRQDKDFLNDPRRKLQLHRIRTAIERALRE
jgi:hypothetical protein